MILLSGCIGNRELVTKEETKEVKTSTKADIQGIINLPMPEYYDGKNIPRPNMTITINEQTIDVPGGSTGEIKIGIKDDTSVISSLLKVTKIDPKSSRSILFIIGSIISVTGIGLFIYGIRKLGAVVGIMGILFVSLAVAIETYPWAFLVFLGLFVIISIYFIYTEIIKRRNTRWMEEDFYTVKKLSEFIGKLPEYELNKIKDALKKDDNSAMLRKVTRLARGLEDAE